MDDFVRDRPADAGMLAAELTPVQVERPVEFLLADITEALGIGGRALPGHQAEGLLAPQPSPEVEGLRWIWRLPHVGVSGGSKIETVRKLPFSNGPSIRYEQKR